MMPRKEINRNRVQRAPVMTQIDRRALLLGLAALPLDAGAKAAPKFGGATVFIDGFEHGVLDVGDWDSGDFTLDFWTNKNSSKRWVSDLMLHCDGNSRQRDKLIRELCRVIAQIKDRSPCANKQHHVAVVVSKWGSTTGAELFKQGLR